MIIIKTTEDTVFKSKPVQSLTLNNSEKQSVAKGQKYEISSYIKTGNHFKISLDCRTWYVYEDHVTIIKNGWRVHPNSVRLKVPYKSQLDNQNNPTGTCNLTSIAMCLAYFGVKAKSHEQLEDELYKYALIRGYNYKSPYDLARIVKEYGLKDIFKTNATIEEVKSWLVNGNPTVLHGYFTSFGHIVVAVGFDNRGLLVHDPYGEWFSTGYRTDLSGAYLHYSYGLIHRTCMHDGNFWVHFISS